MNTIHQISLKLRMGIHPAAQIQPEMLRAMWRQLSLERIEAPQANVAKKERTPAHLNPAGKVRFA
jgi:hypothetical protein